MRESCRLTPGQIDALVARVAPGDLDDIRFAQAQVRRFAGVQRGAIRDVEVETLPGVILGHRNIPVQSVGCYAPAGKFPMVASAHMSVVTASVAGVPRIAAATAPFQGEPNPAVIAAMHLGGAHEIYGLGGVQAVGALACPVRSMCSASACSAQTTLSGLITTSLMSSEVQQLAKLPQVVLGVAARGERGSSPIRTPGRG